VHAKRFDGAGTGKAAGDKKTNLYRSHKHRWKLEFLDFMGESVVEDRDREELHLSIKTVEPALARVHSSTCPHGRRSQAATAWACAALRGGARY